MLDTLGIQEKIRQFAQAREWEQFHDPKNLVMALSVEVSELMEHFQWLTAQEARSIMGTDKQEAIRHEIADVAVYLLRLCDVLKIDLGSAIAQKMALNAQKYPVDKARGHAKKYNE